MNDIECEGTIFTMHEWEWIILSLHEWEKMILRFHEWKQMIFRFNERNEMKLRAHEWEQIFFSVRASYPGNTNCTGRFSTGPGKSTYMVPVTLISVVVPSHPLWTHSFVLEWQSHSCLLLTKTKSLLFLQNKLPQWGVQLYWTGQGKSTYTFSAQRQRISAFRLLALTTEAWRGAESSMLREPYTLIYLDPYWTFPYS